LFVCHQESIAVALFAIFEKSIELPAILVTPTAPSLDATAWLGGYHMTVRLNEDFMALRVHTNNKAFPGRQASPAAGRWILIGDVIQTSVEIADSRSLPTDNPLSMVSFTHTSEAELSKDVIVNIGLASPKFGGKGGEFQAEYVSGPHLRFSPLQGRHWSGREGNA
jgi:hypothetical protein